MDQIEEGVYVHTSNYRFTHGKNPSGRGSWAFGHVRDPKPEHIFWHNGTYGDAKKAAVTHAKQRGHSEIHVLTESTLKEPIMNEDFEPISDMITLVREEKNTYLPYADRSPSAKKRYMKALQNTTGPGSEAWIQEYLATKRKAAKQEKLRREHMREEFVPVADVITLVANDQHAEASQIVNDLLSARVLDSLQAHKETIAQLLFAPGADSLSEEVEELDEKKLSKKDMTLKKGMQRAWTKEFQAKFTKEEVEELDEKNQEYIAPATRTSYQKRYGSNWYHHLKKDKSVKEEVEELDEENWIAGAVKNKGGLHRALHVPQGEKIPAGKIEAASHEGGKIGKEANLAKTLKGFHEGFGYTEKELGGMRKDWADAEARNAKRVATPKSNFPLGMSPRVQKEIAKQQDAKK